MRYELLKKQDHFSFLVVLFFYGKKQFLALGNWKFMKRIFKSSCIKLKRDVVKSTDQNIDNVYVSVNLDFYERTTSYANDIRNGRPIAGFFDEFNTLVRRIFPTQR
jgi:Sporulation lipoprotein YhcN/YlaJ (Spore_YhcN_YlaJ)